MKLREPVRNRRSVLAFAAGAVGIAGCLGGGSESEDSDEDGGTDDESAFPDHPGEEPIDPPVGRRCDGPCGMEPADYPEWNAQIAHGTGEGAFFDTPGCLVAYHHDPTFYDGPNEDIARIWVRDFGTKSYIDATTAVFVLDYEKDRMDEPMAHNPKPFADRNDAVAYVESYDDLGADDIVDLGAFGAEQAHRYRDYPLPE